MISLKIMDRMAVIMKNKECMNCGSKTFHQVGNGWKCDYCGTVYLNPKKPSSKRPPVDVSPHKKNKSRIIVGLFFPLRHYYSVLYFSKEMNRRNNLIRQLPLLLANPNQRTVFLVAGAKSFTRVWLLLRKIMMQTMKNIHSKMGQTSKNWKSK